MVSPMRSGGRFCGKEIKGRGGIGLGGLTEEILLFRAAADVAFHRFDLVDELADVLELTVDGGVANVGDGVDVTQRGHDFVANGRGGDFTNVIILQLEDDFLDGFVDDIHGNRALLAGFDNTAEKFVSFEILTPSIALDHGERSLFQGLVGGEAVGAFQTFAATTNRAPVFGHPGVDDFVIMAATSNTSHFS